MTADGKGASCPSLLCPISRSSSSLPNVHRFYHGKALNPKAYRFFIRMTNICHRYIAATFQGEKSGVSPVFCCLSTGPLRKWSRQCKGIFSINVNIKEHFARSFLFLSLTKPIATIFHLWQLEKELTSFESFAIIKTTIPKNHFLK